MPGDEQGFAFGCREVAGIVASLRDDRYGDAHIPVLLTEAVNGLCIKPAGFYVDCTFGRGGHSRAVLASLGPEGRVLAMDRDVDALVEGQNLAAHDSRFQIKREAFSNLGNVVREFDPSGSGVDGILLDLGVSSPQLECAQRGFSFTRDGPLDMRMDQACPLNAGDWLAHATEHEMSRIFADYGEERHSRRIARAIVNFRGQQAIVTTRQLADVVKAAHPAWEPGQHPATRVFQAIRIFINRELDELHAVLPQAVQALAAGGRLVVISFHSLEDRIVKRYLRREVKGDEFPPGLPVQDHCIRRRLRLIGKATRPSSTEVASNPRARSAILRVAERLA